MKFLLFVASISASVPLVAFLQGSPLGLPDSVDSLRKNDVDFGVCTNTLVVDWPELDAADFTRYRDAFVGLESALKTAQSTFNVPAFALGQEAPTLDFMIQKLETSCGPSSVYNWNDLDLDSLRDVDGQLSIGNEIPIGNRLSNKNVLLKASLTSYSTSGPKDRFDALKRDDRVLSLALKKMDFLFGSNYLVILTSSGGLRKRDLPSNSLARPYSQRSLFQKYQFFSPAIFMGLTSMVVVIAITLVGVNVLLSLQTPTKFENPRREK